MAEIKQSSEMETILKLYEEYVAQQTDDYIIDSVKNDLKRIKTLDGTIKLKIELPIQDIIRIFNETGVIQLRKLDSSEKLLIGCGNGPCDPEMDPIEHAHEGFITINPELTMNPSVIGALGINKGMQKILPKDHYRGLYNENMSFGVSIIGFDMQILSCMKKDFKTFSIGEVEPARSFEESDFFYTTRKIAELISLFRKFERYDDEAGLLAVEYVKNNPEDAKELFAYLKMRNDDLPEIIANGCNELKQKDEAFRKIIEPLMEPLVKPQLRF